VTDKCVTKSVKSVGKNWWGWTPHEV
jgi:hypothetical protein